jgi:hypothetical protein
MKSYRALKSGNVIIPLQLNLLSVYIGHRNMFLRRVGLLNSRDLEPPEATVLFEAFCTCLLELLYFLPISILYSG